MTSSNPIASRLALLYEQWEAFSTDPEARVLRWLIREDERRMLEALLALEDDEEGQLAVLFFVLDTAFERGRYGHELRHDLEQQLAAMGEDFAAAARIRSEATASDIGLLMQTCAALEREVGAVVESERPRSTRCGWRRGRGSAAARSSRHGPRGWSGSGSRSR